MKLLCFSDWRVQPIEEVYKFLRTLGEKPDFILYAGDDLPRFQEEGINITLVRDKPAEQSLNQKPE